MSNKVWPLIRVQAKLGSSQNLFGQASKKKASTSKINKTVSQVFIPIFLFAIIGVPYGYMSYEMTKLAGSPEAQAQTVQNFYIIGLLFCFIAAMTTVPTTHFFSNNAETYMTMPIKENEVSLAMVIGSSIQVYLIVFMMMSGIVVGNLVANFSIQALIGWILTLLFMPIVPIILVSIVFILLIRFIPALHSKYRLQRFTTVFTMVATIGLVLFLNTSTSNTIADNVSVGMNMPQPLLGSLSWYLPLLGAGEMVALSFVKGLFYQLITLAICLVVLALVTRSGYFAIIQSVQGSAGKKLSKEEKWEAQSSVSKQASSAKTLLKREIKAVWSTPAYMVNGPLANLIVPVVMIFSSGLGVFREAGGLDGIMEMIKAAHEFLPIVVGGISNQILYGSIIGFGIGFALGPMNSLSATAFSRDAKHLDSLMSFPLRAKEIVFAKLFPGIAFAFLGSILIMIPLLVVGWTIPVLSISLFITNILGMILINELGLLLDFKSPKLNWDDELKAIKGNANAAILIFLSFAIVGACIAAFFVLPFTFEQTGMLVLGFLFLLLIVVTVYLFARVDKLWHKLSYKL